MTSEEILKMIKELIVYCYSDKAKRSEIIKRLRSIEEELNAVLPFD